MADRVEFDIEEIREFGRSVDEFCQEAEDIVHRMDAALLAVRDSWRDRQLEKPAESIMSANAALMGIVNDLYPAVQDFLRRQEQWYDEYCAI